MAAAAVKSSRRGGGGGSGEDFSAWLGGAGYSEGDVRDIVADTLHGSRSDPTCENWEEVEQLCDHLDRWSPEERITMLDIVVAASADDDSGSDLEGGKDDERDVVYVVSGTATAAAATAVLKAPDGASGASASRTGSPLRVTLCRAASSNPGELSGVSTAAERLIVAMGTHTSSTSLPASSVSSPVGSGTFLGPSLFSAGAHAAGVGNSDDPSKESLDGARGEDSGNLLPGRNQRLFRAGVSDKSARVRVNFRSMGGKEDNAEGERSGSAAAAAAAAAGGDVGVAVWYLDSVGATVTGVELVLDESGEDCTGLYLSCQPASVLADKAGAAAAAGGAVGGVAGEATAAPLHSAPCRLQLDQQQIGSDLLLA
ncbi:unnamed protein product [Closterium sp. Naga37s-1]|nr:unnamed protein product [Closterium sp. Naga37s-1]